jgi:hypothetical protein
MAGAEPLTSGFHRHREPFEHIHGPRPRKPQHAQLADLARTETGAAGASAAAAAASAMTSGSGAGAGALLGPPAAEGNTATAVSR